MAYQYDELGNVVGEYESEEERKRRLDAQQANTPVKQTLTTNPDGTQEMTIKGTPQALSPMNPNTPTVSGPATPDQTFNRMLQAESGNRQVDSRGRIMTSPKGALGAAQIMPATAMNPGFGVPSIFDLAAKQGIQVQNRDEATAKQLLANEQLNRQFGSNYYNAMNSRFGGQGGVAAYNAGPGAIERNIRTNQGRMNVSQLPRETQGYLQKVGNIISNVIPSAQAAAVPQGIPTGQNARDDLMLRQRAAGSVSPQQVVQQQAMAQQAPQLAPQPAPQPDSVINDQVAAYEAKQQQQQQLNLPDDAYQRYLNLQNNPRDMLNFAYDENNPENLRKHVKARASDLLAQEAGIARAEAQVKTMDENAVAKALREKTTGGSYVKAILFGMLGMERSAMAEAAKLGIGNEIMASLNNEPVMVKVAANGTPISGINAKTGNELTAQELIAATQGAQTVKNTEVEAGTYMDPTGTVPGNWVLERRPGGSVYRQVGTGSIASPQQANALRKVGVGGTLGDQRAKMIQEINLKLQGKTQEEAMAILRPYNQALAGAQLPIINPSELNISAPQIAGGAPATTGGAPATTGGAPATTGGAGSAPATTGGAPAGKRPTMEELEAKKEAGKIIIGEAAKQVAASADTQNMIKSIDRITGLIDSGKHNIGSLGSTLSGRGRIAQAIGEFAETDDAKNTKTIMDTVQKLASDGLKALGTNPSTIDLEFWTKFKPQATDNPDYVREWIQSRSEDLKRRLGYAGAQVSAAGQAGTAPAAAATPAPQNEKPRKMSAEDRQAIEWARQNPNDPRSAQIKQRLGL